MAGGACCVVLTERIGARADEISGGEARVHKLPRKPTDMAVCACRGSRALQAGAGWELGSGLGLLAPPAGSRVCPGPLSSPQAVSRGQHRGPRAW